MYEQAAKGPDSRAAVADFATITAISAAASTDTSAAVLLLINILLVSLEVLPLVLLLQY